MTFLTPNPKQIRIALIRNDLKNFHLAKICRLNYSDVSMILNGRKNVTQEKAERIAKALNHNVEDLFTVYNRDARDRSLEDLSG